MTQTVMGGEDGSIYLVTPDGDLLWYGDAHRNGTPGWRANSGDRIGTGWQDFRLVFGGPDGVLYAIRNDGDLLWYRDVHRDGTPGWASGSGQRIGNGWEDIRWRSATATAPFTVSIAAATSTGTAMPIATAHPAGRRDRGNASAVVGKTSGWRSAAATVSSTSSIAAATYGPARCIVAVDVAVPRPQDHHSLIGDLGRTQPHRSRARRCAQGLAAGLRNRRLGRRFAVRPLCAGGSAR
jgi:hypothetical protein